MMIFEIVRWLTFALWWAFGGAMWQIRLRTPERDAVAPISPLGVLFSRIFQLLMLISIVTGLAINVGWIALNPGWWVIPGATLAAIGIGGIFYSGNHLGVFWTPGAIVQPQHRVIDRGPYGIVRHPIYASVLLYFVGYTIVFPAWWMFGVLAAAIGIYIYWTKGEDDFLARELSGYADYRDRVRHRLVPGIW